MESHFDLGESANFMTYNGNHLFHYTSFSSALKIIVSGKLLFGEFKNMNDISESHRDVMDPTLERPLHEYKSISLTYDCDKRGFAIDSLWGHYAEKGNGVCLVFKKDLLIAELDKYDRFHKHDNVDYIKNFTNAIFHPNILGNPYLTIEENYKDIFFTKSLDWQVEQEYRLLLKGKECSKESLSYANSLIGVIICFPLLSELDDVRKSCEYQIIRKLTDLPIMRYHTALGNKNLFELETGNKLWPLLGVDYQIDEDALKGM